MIVVLDKTLEEVPLAQRFYGWSKEDVVKTLKSKAKDKGFNAAVNVTLEDRSTNDALEFNVLGFIGMLSRAYSNHLPVVVAPHDFWFIANSELAAIVSKNPEQFRSVFSAQESGKETVMVQTSDPSRIHYDVLVNKLEEKFPNKEVSDLLIPGLTTMDSQVFNALCATLADTVQHYYSYMTFCCGIPKIKVRGTKGDYWKLADNSRRLAEIFAFSEEAVAYYDRIAGLFDRMASSLSELDPSEFWRGIFTQKNVGSGGQLEIDGWIRDFFSKRPRELENYETSVATVPYKSLETGIEYLGLTGAFAAVQDKEGFWRSEFREVVYKKVDPKDADPDITSYGYAPEGITTHYSDGSKKFIPYTPAELKEKAEAEKKAREAMSKWTIRELPVKSVGFTAGGGLDLVDGVLTIKKVEESSNVGIPDPFVAVAMAYASLLEGEMKKEDKK